MEEIDKEANKILKRELGDECVVWTYEEIRTYQWYGYAGRYLDESAKLVEFSSSAKIGVMLKLAELDLKRGTTIPELVFKCCQFYPNIEALEKLIELGNQNETGENVVKSVLEFQDHNGDSCLTYIFQMATAYSQETDEDPSGSMLHDIEESCTYLIYLAKSLNLDLTKILNHTAKGGSTLFRAASKYSEKITRLLLEENVNVKSIDHLFTTPYFQVRSNCFSQ